MFWLLDPGGAPREEDQGALSFWRGAGANFLVRYASRSLAQGRLVIESECINLETGAVVLKKSFMGEAAATTRMAHRMVDFVVGRVTGTEGGGGFHHRRGPLHRARHQGDLRPVPGRPQPAPAHPIRQPHHPSGVAPDGRLACVTYRGAARPRSGAKAPPGRPVPAPGIRPTAAPA